MIILLSLSNTIVFFEKLDTQWEFDHRAQCSPCVAMLMMNKWWLLKMIRSWYLKKNYVENFDKMKVCKSGFVKMQWRCYCKVLWWHMKGAIATGQGKGWQVPFHPPSPSVDIEAHVFVNVFIHWEVFWRFSCCKTISWTLKPWKKLRAFITPSFCHESTRFM